MKTEELRKILNDTLRLESKRAREKSLIELENFLSNNVISPTVKEYFDKDSDELRRLQSENLLINWSRTFVDNHPCSDIREISEPVRAIIWKCAGVKCDDFSKLHIGKWVRFFNPRNITLVTGGYPMYFAGARSTSFIDGRDTVVIFGPIDFASGVKIFTHLHNVNNPNLPHYYQGRVSIPSIIYPDCSIGEDTQIIGTLQLKSIVANMSVTSARRSLPPYSIIGGIGNTYRVIRHLDFPETFPPEYLQKVLNNTKRAFPILGSFLEKYYVVIEEYICADGDKAENWNITKEKVRNLESSYLTRLTSQST